MLGGRCLSMDVCFYGVEGVSLWMDVFIGGRCLSMDVYFYLWKVSLYGCMFFAGWKVSLYTCVFLLVEGVSLWMDVFTGGTHISMDISCIMPCEKQQILKTYKESYQRIRKFIFLLSIKLIIISINKMEQFDIFSRGVQYILSKNIHFYMHYIYVFTCT